MLDMATCQANAEVSQSMKIDDLLANPEVKADFGDLLNNNQIEILNTLKESVFFILQQWQIDDINDSVWIFLV